MDILDREERSRRMKLVRQKNTAPELMLRRWLHARGYRYRLHVLDLPGRPDLVFPSLRKVVFVHGCFWHHHRNCRLAKVPATRTDFWVPKLLGNAERDARKCRELAEAGWTSLVVWQCELRDLEATGTRVIRFLDKKTVDNALNWQNPALTN